MSIDMQQFHAVFFAETRDHINELETLLLDIDVHDYDNEDINTIFRAAHSIKGSSGVFGFDKLADVTHCLETLFDKIRKNQRELDRDCVDLSLESVDVLAQILDLYQAEESIPTVLYDELLVKLNNALQIQPNTKDTASNVTDAHDDFGFFASAAAPEPDHTHHNDDEDFGFFDLPPKTQAEEEFGFFEPLPQTTPSSEITPPQSATTEPRAPTQNKKTRKKAANDNTDNQTIRVETNKIDSLVNIMGELVIADSVLQQLHQEDAQASQKMQSALENVNHNIRLMQEAVMAMRLLPLSFIFNRFNRVVRDLSRQLDKNVELLITGGDTEIDKGMIEQLVDPLTHLLRNAIDHGIETNEIRQAQNKPLPAQIKMHAEQRGGYIFIEISDDGAGLNQSKILQSALDKGLINHLDYSPEDTWPLILEAGFSTAQAVSDLSGRGVGMDVVVQNLKAINGSLNIASTAGKGATFTIKLPLTMAIVDGMKVMCNEQLYVVPMNLIVESFRPTPEQINTIANDQLVEIRNTYYPLLSLHDAFHDGANKPKPEQSIVILIAVGNLSFCLHVDSLEGVQQVVIKSLEKNYHAVSGLAGATIMGDGNVAFILDVEQLANEVKHMTECEI